MTKLILRYDSRDKIFQQRFGQVNNFSDFPDDIEFDTNFQDEVQPFGDVKCVAYATCDIAEDQENLEFDITSIDDLWKRVPKSPTGSDPRDVLREAVANGLLPKDGQGRLTNWKSFWRADLGDKDSFDNLRSTMLLIKGSVLIGTFWYEEWHGKVLPIGKKAQNGHAYVAHGWKQINGEPHLKIQAWTGKEYFMPRDTFNTAMKPWGMQTWVLSTSEMDAKRIKTLTETIKDLCVNLIIKLRDMIKAKNVEPVVPAPVPTPEPPKPPVLEEPPRYDWDTPVLARHSVRVICDEEKLSVKDKNELCATIGAESGWNPNAVGQVNPDEFRSVDYGICQINDHYWIGAGKRFPSKKYVLDNPEICVRWMCAQWKQGNKNWWYGYKDGHYKKFL